MLTEPTSSTINGIPAEHKISDDLQMQIALFQLSFEPIFVWEPDGGVVYWNQGCEELYGYSINEALGKASRNLLKSEFPVSFEDFKKTLETTGRWSGKIRQTTKDGRVLTVESRRMLTTINGKRLVIEANRDVSEQNLAEEKLRASEERYRAFIEQSSEGIWRFELDEPISIDLPIDEQLRLAFERGYIAECNDAMARMYGVERAEQIVGARLSDLFVTEDAANDAYYSAFLESGYCLSEAESHEKDANGRDVYFSNNLVGIIEDKKLVRVWGTQRDVTALKESEQVLARYQLVSAQARDIVFMLRPTGEIIEANRAAQLAYGYSHEELLTMNIADLRLAEKLTDLPQQLEKANLDGILFETVHRRKDGTTLDVEINAVGTDIGKERFILSIVRDVTERKQAEEQLRQSRTHLQMATEAAQVGTWQWNVRTNKLVWSSIHKRIWGYEPSPEPISFTDWSNLVDERDLARAEQAIEDTLKTGAPYDVEYRIVPIGKKEPRWIRSIGKVKSDEAGEPFQLYGISQDITDRKQFEIALRESEERFRNMADNAPMMVWVTDTGGQCIYLSKSWYEFTGQTPETGFGLGWVSATHPDDQKRAEEAFLAANASRGVFHVEYRLRRKDGEYRWAIDSAIPRLDENGEFLGYIGSVIDIHERKQIEEQISYQLNLNRTITDNTQMCLLMMDWEGRGTFANQATERVTGFKPEELIGEILHNKIHHTHPDGTAFPLAECPLDNALPLQEAVVGYEDVFVHKNGRFYPVRCSARPIYKDDKPIGTVIEVQDITEEKRAQEVLLKAERHAVEEYQSLLSRIVPLAQTLGTARDLTTIYRAIGDFVRVSMPCAGFFVSFYDADKHLRTAAYGWAEGAELNTDKLPPMPLVENGGPNSHAIFKQQTIVVNNYKEVMKNRPHVLIGDDDGIIPDSSLVAPMIVMGRITGTLEVQAYEAEAFNQDHIVALEMAANLAAVAIENVRLLEIEANARRDAELANRSKDEFLAVLSHELRTPLNSMFGWVRMLNTGQLDAEKTKRAVEVIERNINLQTKLIEDILDVSRIISGKIRLENRQIDFLPLVNSVIELNQPTAETKNVELITEFDSEACIMNGDAERLQQVVNNLFTNAIKFTPAGGKIIVKLNCNETRVELNVNDSGVGIEPEFLPYVFDRFRQADSSSKRKHGGLGLGLAIVKHLVEMHGGEVSADSAGVNQGSTFTIRLPMHSRASFIEEEKSQLIEEKETSLENVNLLVVDDDTDALEMLRTLLSSHGAQVQIASSAAEALKLLEENVPDVLVSDIGMPEMNGTEFIAKLRQSENKRLRDIPAIALTAFASTEDRERILAAGFDQYQSKPVISADLLFNIKNQSKRNKSA
jgi:PAS domain S-box-containing protein